jgi:hypothetical protein
LERAEAGFVTGLGPFRVRWERKGKGDGRGYGVVVETPVGTKGVVRLPVDGMGGNVTVVNDGEAIEKERYTIEEGRVVLELDGGVYDIRVSK